ncbi:MAG: hypothetical protein ACW98X_17760, partial [Promethearchaeota archaeon]|jgi:hypothetical protein
LKIYETDKGYFFEVGTNGGVLTNYAFSPAEQNEIKLFLKNFEVVRLAVGKVNFGKAKGTWIKKVKDEMKEQIKDITAEESKGEKVV